MQKKKANEKTGFKRLSAPQRPPSPRAYLALAVSEVSGGLPCVFAGRVALPCNAVLDLHLNTAGGAGTGFK